MRKCFISGQEEEAKEGEKAWKGKDGEKEELTSLHYFSFIFKLFLISNN